MARQHPLRDITFVRESPMRASRNNRGRPATRCSRSGPWRIWRSASRSRLRIYFADLPRQARGELDLMRADVLPDGSVASMQTDLHVRRRPRIASRQRPRPCALVLSERRIVLDEVSRQRGLVMDAISVEAERAVAAVAGTLAGERSELLRRVEAERLATLEWATAERRETIAEVRHELEGSMKALRGERSVIVGDVRHIVNLVLLRIAIFIVAAVALAPVVAHAYARVSAPAMMSRSHNRAAVPSRILRSRDRNRQNGSGERS